MRKLVGLLTVAAALLAGEAMGLLVPGGAAERPLPAGYRPLEWIESTGMQLLDTGVDVGPATVLEMNFGQVKLGESGSDVLVGASGFTHYTYLLTIQKGNLNFYGHGNRVVSDFKLSADYWLRIDARKISVKEKGCTAAWEAPVEDKVDYRGDRKLRLFGVNTFPQYSSRYRLYDAKVWTNRTVLARDFVPCRRPGGEAGLWDRVSGRFFMSAYYGVEGGFAAPGDVPERDLARGRRGFWDLKALYRTPQSFKVEIPCRNGWGGNDKDVHPIFIEGEPYHGKPTRVFAWWGLPAGASPTNKVPAMVLVHGGGGTAFSSWAKLWMDRGYAVIAMDTCGSIPQGERSARHPRHPWSGPFGMDTALNPADPDVKDHWTYHAVAAVMRCHSWIRSLPEVDPARTGLTGISWGGYLTSIVGAVDTRFKFAAPVYGCGYYPKNFEWWNKPWNDFSATREGHRAWFALWDPSEYLQSPKYRKGIPYLWCDGTNDRWYPFDALRMSCNLLDNETPLNLSLKLRMPHGYAPHGDPKEITALANHYLKGAPPLVDVTHAWERDGKLFAEFDAHGRTLVRAELLYTTSRNGILARRPWQVKAVGDFAPATGKVAVALPPQTSCYVLNLITDDGLVASSRIFQRETWGLVDNPRNPNTDWMVGGKGVFAHYLINADLLPRLGEFNAEALADQLADMKADWFCFTLGQNSGAYCAPNAAYDRLCGYAPGTHCATRDIPAEIAAALKKRGIRFLLYLPCQPANGDAVAEAALGFPAGPANSDRVINAAAAEKWSEVIEEWSRRYGESVAGWWFDGGYRWCRFNDQIAGLYAAAVKRGNPRAVVAFNEGVVSPVRRWTHAGDYAAGEVNQPFAEKCPGRWVGDRQWHVLTFCGSTWGNPDCRYTDEQWIAWLKPTLAAGGAVTIDIAIDRPSGRLNSQQAAQLKRVFEKVGR